MSHLRNFVLGWYQLKAVETHPFRLRFDPTDNISRFLWFFVPVFSFSTLAELWLLRKNAMIAIVGGSAVCSFALVTAARLMARKRKQD